VKTITRFWVPILLSILVALFSCLAVTTPSYGMQITQQPSIAGGGSSSYALKPDGTVWAWGANGNGQLGNNSLTDSSVPVQVSNLSGVTAIAGGGGSGYALKSDGTVWAWGANGNGQLGNNSTTDSSVPVQVSGLTGITAITGGTGSVYALKSDGTVWTWGYNASGQLGNNSTTDSHVPVQVLDSTGSTGLSGVIAIAGGGGSGYALKSDGTVWAWGANAYGQLGNNSTTVSHVPVQVLDSTGSTGLTGVTAVAAGGWSGYALKSDGTVWAWGLNSSGQLGNDVTTDNHVPVQVLGLTGVTAIASKYESGYALKSDGTVWAWGYNSDGELGNNLITNSPVAVQVSGLSGVTAIAGGGYFGYALKSDGTVWDWGANFNGQLGNNSTTESHVPVKVSGLTGIGSASPAPIAAGGNSGYALKPDGTVWAWGSNAFGQLGNNSATDSSVPVQVVDSTGLTGLSGVTAVAGGTNSGYALKADGTVWAWGQNSSGQLGNNSTTDSSVPVQVLDSTGSTGLSGVTAIAAGTLSGYALKSDGTVWAWGQNSSGQLGNNLTTDSSVPVQVLDSTGSTGLSGVTAIAGGAGSGYAVKADGSVWAWGSNSSGQLGNNSIIDSHIPVQVSGLTGVMAVAAGGWSGYALKSDGTAWAWGYNSNGQLGNNSITDSLVPVQVLDSTGSTGLSGVTAIAGEYVSGYALKSDGTAWAWGSNAYGQLGNNSITDSSIPVQVSGVTGVTAVAGNQTGYALKSDGTVWAWGYNTQGELGNNSTTNSSVPLQVLLPGTATQLVWHTQPGGSQAGANLNPQPFLYLEDVNGNIVTTDSSSTVTVALTTPNGATLGGTTTVTLNAGVATFTNLNVDTAGSYTLTPTINLTGITSPASNSFTITATPSLTSTLTYSPAGPYKSGTSVTITATFSQAVTSPQITLSGADTLAAAAMTQVDPTHFTYSYSAGSGSGAVTVALSNATVTSGATFTLDNSAPIAAGPAVLAITTLATGLNDSRGIAVDTDGVYFMEVGTSTGGVYNNGSGTVKKVGINGGTVTTLATGLNTPWTGGIKTDATNVYWVDGGTNTGVVYNKDGDLKAVAKSGSSVLTLATGLDGPDSVAVDADSVYWLETGDYVSGSWNTNSGAINKVPKGGGTVTPLVTSHSFGYASIAVDGSSLYWAGYADGTVSSIGKAGGTVTQLTSGSYPTSMVVDAVNIYWVNNGDGSIHKMSKSGSADTILASGPSWATGPLAVDATNVYWFESGATLQTIPIAGGTVTTLATGLHEAAYIVADSTGVYWTERGTSANNYTDGTVNKMLVNPGIMINNGATTTNNPTITLSLFATDPNGVAQMQFSNDNVTYSAAEAYSTTKSWTLTSGDGLKTVYVKFQDAAGNWSVPYSATITFQGYSVSGTVTSGGSALQGVAVTLSGNSSGTTTTDNAGNYSFTGLSNGSYTVTPSKAGYSFNPPSQNISVNNGNLPGVNFSVMPTYSVISAAGTNGTITPAGTTVVAAGTPATFTITPDSGYQVVTPIGGTCPQGILNGTAYTTGPINTSCTVNAVFSRLPTGKIASDGSSAVTIADALRALQIAVGLITPTANDLANGDVAPLVNGKPSPNGAINVGDAIVILQKSLGIVNW